MPKTLVNQYLGPAGTPQEVKDLRKSSFDLHDELGTPVIFKHRWNDNDVKAGRTWLCPYHDELYGNRDVTWDSTCFGTGYVGGYSDGTIIFVTIQDTQETQIKVTPQGVLTMDMHPALTAPWLPELGDGDLVVIADFDPINWQITDEYERYTLRDVTPVSMRGPGWGRQSGSLIHRQRISQQSNLDKLPPNHPLYQVPIVFDYSNVPHDPTPPYQPEPTPGQNYTAVEFGVVIHGIENVNPIPPDIGTLSEIAFDARITSIDPNPGTVVDF